MKGSINYFRKLREICQEHEGECKKCPLGKYEELKDCRCPRLVPPRYMTDGKIVNMVRI